MNAAVVTAAVATEIVAAAEMVGAAEVAGTSVAAQVEGGASDCMVTETTVSLTCTGQSQRMGLNFTRMVPAYDAPAVWP